MSRWFLIPFFGLFGMKGNALTSTELHRAEEIFQKHFRTTFQSTHSISPLSGGYSEASNFCLVMGDKRYVLRFYMPDYSIIRTKREFYALKEGSKRGIAPLVHEIYLEDRAVIMDFVPGQTLTPEQAHIAVNRVKVAKALRKLHATKKNPHIQNSFKDRLEKFSGMISQYVQKKTALVEAMDIIHKETESLEAVNRLKVNIHGDLNPRNIFITEDGALFIDWSEAGSEHPYFDLTCFSLLHNYSEEEESLFLADYCQREPTPEEKREFLMVKKINLAALSITCQGVALRMLSKEPQKIDPNTPLKEWSFYVLSFARNDQPLSPQFFSEMSLCAIALAKSL